EASRRKRKPCSSSTDGQATYASSKTLSRGPSCLGLLNGFCPRTCRKTFSKPLLATLARNIIIRSAKPSARLLSTPTCKGTETISKPHAFSDCTRTTCFVWFAILAYATRSTECSQVLPAANPV